MRNLIATILLSGLIGIVGAIVQTTFDIINDTNKLTQELGFANKKIKEATIQIDELKYKVIIFEDTVKKLEDKLNKIVEKGIDLPYLVIKLDENGLVYDFDVEGVE